MYSVLMAAIANAALENKWEGGFEFIGASDVTLFEASVTNIFEIRGWEGSANLTYNRTGIDYQPVDFDFQGEAVNRNENAIAFQVNGRRAIGERWTLLSGAGAYDGYTNYRSVWLDEYFHQQYAGLGNIPGFDTYEVAHPKGVNVSTGARWEYRPASGFAELTVSWLGDEVSPGYEIDFDGLVRGPDKLGSFAAALSFENVLTKNMRSRVALSTVKTTDREVRLGLHGALNVALSERLIARFEAGAATESPQFDSFFGNVSIEYEISPAVAVFASARYYEDTGEIENALLFSSSAPGMDSRQAGAGMRWIGDDWSARLFVAPIRVDYEPTNPDTDFFQNLYKDREWTVVQFAFGRSF